MRASLVTPPTSLPVTLNEVKEHLRIESTFTDDDAYIRSLIFAATVQAESILRRKLVTQTWKYLLDNWPDEDWITLPYGQLQSVTSVKYRDSDDDENTFSSDDYLVDTDSDPGRVVLGYGESWPSTTLLPKNPIYVEFVTGYGDHSSQTITDATNASPIVLTIAGHGYSAGDKVLVESVAGNTAANGNWHITVVDVNTFSLNGSTGNAAYTSGGTSVEISVPETVRHAIKMMVSEFYENREETIIGTITSKIKDAIINLLYSHRLFGF